VAAKAGINLRTMIEVIRTGGAGNFFTERMVEGINERGRPTQFALALAAKDAGLLLEVARETGVPVPVAAEVAQALVAAVEARRGRSRRRGSRGRPTSCSPWSAFPTTCARSCSARRARWPAPGAGRSWWT